MTNVPPAIPMNKRRMTRPAEELTKPVQAVGMDAIQRMTANKTRAPTLSQRGPRMKRMTMVPPTPMILDVQTCWFDRPSVSRISERRGAMANQTKKATKNPHQEQWNALMCGRAKLHNLISVALSSWSGSTLTEYSEYFFHSPWCVKYNLIKNYQQTRAKQKSEDVPNRATTKTKQEPLRHPIFDCQVSVDVLTGAPLSTPDILIFSFCCRSDSCRKVDVVAESK